MARTLSDTLIIAMIEAATRLTAGRGPIGPGSAGAAAAAAGGAVAAPATGETGATANTIPPATGTGSGGSGGAGGAAGAPGGEQDPRTAEQVAADFRTIYAQIEDVVRVSAEQETKSVGFAPR
ncbi:MAG: hypothetical protein AVDCRST_MAG77-1940 [uncultured Chloroflexi bacterium]|uniref:Uncharacterized protein n=1 Tax=uncultured Chloroflexota bacterium TaxID=166587 RepID=A0A6J4GYJ7_9CHLR|nr:MAG: hypothetical protein AVDCRST_MAG77-1940 [uncultured Chloroflexota bacterium]